MPRLVQVGIGCMLAMNLLVGCASHSRTTRTETVVESSTQPSEHPVEKQVVVEKETKTEVHQEPRGVLSTIVHVVGEIIALPFRLIGGLIRMIF